MYQKVCSLRSRRVDHSRDQKQVAADPTAAKPQPTPVSRQLDVPKGLPGAASLSSLNPNPSHHLRHNAPLSPESQRIEDRQHERMLARPHSAGNAPVAPWHPAITLLPPRFQISMAGRPQSAQPGLGSYPGLAVSQSLQAASVDSTNDRAQQMQPLHSVRLNGGGSPASQVCFDPAPVSQPLLMTLAYLAMLQHLSGLFCHLCNTFLLKTQHNAHEVTS